MIYKGCQKKMIIIKNPGSRFFEEAYFILKEDQGEDERDMKDMVEEANRIISKNIQNKEKKRPRLRPLIISLSAVSACSLLFSVILLIIR